MKFIYDKMVSLILRGKPYIYPEKYDLWVKYVYDSVLSNNHEAEVMVLAMEMLDSSMNSSLILDEIYSSRLSCESIHSILMFLLKCSKNGTKFFREIYNDYMVESIDLMIRDAEKGNHNVKQK